MPRIILITIIIIIIVMVDLPIDRERMKKSLKINHLIAFILTSKYSFSSILYNFHATSFDLCKTTVGNLRPAGRIWPARHFFLARQAYPFWRRNNGGKNWFVYCFILNVYAHFCSQIYLKSAVSCNLGYQIFKMFYFGPHHGGLREILGTFHYTHLLSSEPQICFYLAIF